MLIKLALNFACFMLTDGYPRENIGIKRFLHGCPFAFPCPPPPCENPVFGPHDCCGTCSEPNNVSSATTIADKKPDSLDNFHLKLRTLDKLRKKLGTFAGSDIGLHHREATTTMYPTSSECPSPCTHQGYHYCHPLPCYIPCVDGVRRPGACCYECLNGPNCSHDEQIIPEGQNVTLPSGDVAFCSRGGIHGGQVDLYKVLG